MAVDPGQPGAEPAAGETPRSRAVRRARRGYLYAWAGALVILLVLLVILIVQNTRHVRVGWVFGHSHVSLVVLVLFATVLGWLLGITTSVLVRRRTRAPRV